MLDKLKSMLGLGGNNNNVPVDDTPTLQPDNSTSEMVANDTCPNCNQNPCVCNKEAGKCENCGDEGCNC